MGDADWRKPTGFCENNVFETLNGKYESDTRGQSTLHKELACGTLDCVLAAGGTKSNIKF
jgi:hypothetical protein